MPKPRSLPLWTLRLSVLALSACGSPPPLDTPEPSCQGVNCAPDPLDPSNNSPNNSSNNSPNNAAGDLDLINDCSPGQTRCVDDAQYQECVQDESGAYWQVAQRCPTARCAQDRCCPMACQVGSKLCTEAGVQTCELGADGCPDYGAAVACPNGGSCTALGQCVAGCESTCQPGQQRCFPEGSPAFQACAEFEPGCFQWDSDERQCPGGGICRSGQCVAACSHECTSAQVGDKRCQGTTQQTCQVNAQGCRVWASTGSCQTTTKKSCSSQTLGRVVPHGTCVQVNYNWANCAPDCGWGICNDGLWYCHRSGLSACAQVYNHAACR